LRVIPAKAGTHHSKVQWVVAGPLRTRQEKADMLTG
jgi:hypothetical protein